MSVSAQWLDHERLLWLANGERIELNAEDTDKLLARMWTHSPQSADLAARITEQRPRAAEGGAP